LSKPSDVTITVYSATGKQVKVLVNSRLQAGTYNAVWNTGSSAKGTYFINAVIDGNLKQSVRVSKL